MIAHPLQFTQETQENSTIPSTTSNEEEISSMVILISIDGFRWDYLDIWPDIAPTYF